MIQKPATTDPTAISLNTFFAMRDVRGVLRVRLDLKKYRLRVALAYTCIGVLCATFSCSVSVLWLFRHHRILWPLFILIVEGGLALTVGLRGLWVWRKLQPLTPASVLCERFRLDVEQLAQIAVENGIRPDANVAGQDYYRVTDFGEIATLLRASEQPTAEQEILLRPTTSTKQDAGEQLLRAKA